MKVVFTSQGKDLDSPLDPRFGRCAYFLVVDTEDLSFEAMENPAARGAQGAGVYASQLVVQTGAEAVVTGNIGPKALVVLQMAGIKVYRGSEGTIRENLELFRQGKLPELTEATVSSHAGMGKGMGRGLGGRWPF